MTLRTSKSSNLAIKMSIVKNAIGYSLKTYLAGSWSFMEIFFRFFTTEFGRNTFDSYLTPKRQPIESDGHIRIVLLLKTIILIEQIEKHIEHSFTYNFVRFSASIIGEKCQTVSGYSFHQNESGRWEAIAVPN